MDIRQVILSVMVEDPSPGSVMEFVDVCQKIALILLRRKAVNGRLHPELLSVKIEDIALDCIADLFRRDERGSLIQIRSYFEGIDYQEMTEGELLRHLRRLVFSKTNQGIFQVYNEIDPQLGKILRNIKIAVRALQNFTEVDRFGESCIVPAMCDTLAHLPSIEKEDLERNLRFAVNGGENVPSLLAKLSLFLRQQEEYCRVVPFMTVALAFRAIYAQYENRTSVRPEAEDAMLSTDVRTVIGDICQSLKKQSVRQYVHEKAVDGVVYERYFDIIQKHLELKLMGNGGEGFSFFSQLKKTFPGLTMEEYHKHHRSKIDYLAGVAYRKVVQQLRRDL